MWWTLSFDASLANNSVVKKVAPNETSLIKKQLLGRADYSVLKSLNLRIFRKRMPRLYDFLSRPPL